MGNQPSNGSQPVPTNASGSATSSTNNVNYTSTQANGTGTQTQARKPAQTPIILNVYEPSKPQTAMPGFGIYHTGIEISGVEYCFAGGAEAGAGTGVQSQQPRATPAGSDWKFKESIELGSVAIHYHEFERVLQELKDAFPANTYDLIHRNCNHFTTTVAKRLNVHGKYPGWINRAASWGAVFTAPPPGLKPIELPKPKESVFKSTTGYRMDGAVVQPKGAKGSTTASSTSSKSSADTKKSSTPNRKNPWADPSFVPPGMRTTSDHDATDRKSVV